MERWLWIGLAAIIGAGCRDKGADLDDDDEGETGDAPAQVYPTATKILLYNGHGGLVGEADGPGDIDDIAARWTGQGWEVEEKDALPSDLTPFRAIILIAPGYAESVAFTATQVQSIQLAMSQGSRLVIVADRTTCADANVASLLTALGTTISFTGEGADPNMILKVTSFNLDHQVNEGLTELQLHDPCHADIGESGEELFVDDERNLLAAAQRPGRGGDVVIIGDLRFLDDTGFLEYDDNSKLADNLVKIEPTTAAE